MFPCLQRANWDHSLAGWSARPVATHQQAGSCRTGGKAEHDDGLLFGSSLSERSSSNTSNCSTDDDGEVSCSTDASVPCSMSSSRHQQQQDLSGSEDAVEPTRVRLEPQSRHRRHLSMMKAAAITAAEEAEEAGILQKGGYTGGAAAAGMANLRR